MNILITCLYLVFFIELPLFYFKQKIQCLAAPVSFFSIVCKICKSNALSPQPQTVLDTFIHVGEVLETHRMRSE